MIWEWKSPPCESWALCPIQRQNVHSEVPVLCNCRGFVRLRDQMYLLEPLAGTEAGQRDDRQSSGALSDEGLHAVYNYKHLRRKRSSCSHGNTTTFYDHGAHPSGLFQLGSLVKDARRGNIQKYTSVSSLQLISNIWCCILTVNHFIKQCPLDT